MKYLNWDEIMLARNRERLTLWWAIGLLLSAIAGAAQAQNLEAAKSSVVRIVSPTPEGKPRVGTGFVIKVEDDLAYIVTASHVVEGDPAPQVEFFARRNRLVQASVVKLEGGDPKGIALLMVRGTQNMPPGLPALAFAPSRDVQGGEEVTVIGFGQGQGDWAVIRAHITSVARDFKLDGRIEEGNSGGPVLKDWQVVALVTSVDRGFGLATPSLFVEEILTRWGVSLGAPRPAPVPAPAPPQATTNRYQLASAGVKVGQGHAAKREARSARRPAHRQRWGAADRWQVQHDVRAGWHDRGARCGRRFPCEGAAQDRQGEFARPTRARRQPGGTGTSRSFAGQDDHGGSREWRVAGHRRRSRTVR